ncbi:TPA: LysR family transcriptional regulator [Klebsiella pneumoniae]|nr:LysR family transcriptional regulator [Klebsiella pneumoniae]
MRGIRETFMTTLNLGNLATFRLVVQRGSFSAAADALGISQPAVSLQVRQLEQFLQTRLLAHSEQIDRAVNSAVQSVSAFSQEVNGSLTLGTGATACIHLLPPLLQHLRQQHPLLTVGVTTGNTLDIVRAVEENRLDLGLVTLPVQGRSLAVTAMLDEEFVTIYASRETEMPAVYTPAELQAQPLIAFEAGSGTRDLIDRWFRSAGLAVTPVMQLGSIEAIKRMVRAGLGYSIVPRMAVERVEDRDGLRVHSLAPRLYRQLAVVMRQDKIVTKGIAEMLRLLHTVRL